MLLQFSQIYQVLVLSVPGAGKKTGWTDEIKKYKGNKTVTYAITGY